VNINITDLYGQAHTIDLNNLGNQAFCMDCMELMKALPDKCIDLTVTSPPYDNLREYNGNISQWSFEKFQKIAKEIFRITKDGGSVVWVVADATINGSETGTSFRQALWFTECGFNLHDTMIWDKENCSSVGSMNRYENVFEYMFVLSKSAPKTSNIIKDKRNKRYGEIQSGSIRQSDGTTRKTSQYGKREIAEYGRRGNVWNIYPCKSSDERIHPAPFPLKLATDHIISWSNENDIVFDCFLGSGTTRVAAWQTDRQFLGCEIDKDYYEQGCQRYESYAAQYKLC